MLDESPERTEVAMLEVRAEMQFENGMELAREKTWVSMELSVVIVVMH